MLTYMGIAEGRSQSHHRTHVEGQNWWVLVSVSHLGMRKIRKQSPLYVAQKLLLLCWQTTVLDGRTGEPLVDPYLRSTMGTQLSPLTVAMEGEGNDLFLHWLNDCDGHEGEGTPFRFLEGKLYCHMPWLSCTLYHVLLTYAAGRELPGNDKTVDF